ncbi:MAG TPA: hypothetical protein PKC91_12960 [Ignavibacteria bacterium]|nr:hypothetical protein [Ignavibacteria bacterium]
MKTINFLAVLFTAVLLSLSFNSNSFSSQTGMDCKCCGQECIDAKCCTMETGSSQGVSSCCTDKCISEECKKCCGSGNCSMMKDSNDSTHSQDTMNNESINETDKSCCSDKSKSEGMTKDCCK